MLKILRVHQNGLVDMLTNGWVYTEFELDEFGTDDGYFNLAGPVTRVMKLRDYLESIADVPEYEFTGLCLQEKYAGAEHPDFPVSEWVLDTDPMIGELRGYWDWVAGKVEESALVEDLDA